jgi:hypothetical protein
MPVASVFASPTKDLKLYTIFSKPFAAYPAKTVNKIEPRPESNPAAPPIESKRLSSNSKIPPITFVTPIKKSSFNKSE